MLADDYDTLELAAIEACRDIGCFCEGSDGGEPDMEDDEREKCAMCKLSDVIRGKEGEHR